MVAGDGGRGGGGGGSRGLGVWVWGGTSYPIIKFKNVLVAALTI